MNKYIIKFFFLLSLIIITSCGKKDVKTAEELAATENLEVVDMKGETVNLLYKLEKGDKFRYRLTTEQTANESIQSDSSISSISKQTVAYEFNFVVIDVDAEKTSELEVTISSVKLNANINGEEIKYDAGNSANTAEDKLRFMEYSVIHNIPFRARLTQYGEILEVTRLDKMVEKLNSLQPQQQNLTADQKVQIAQSLADAAIRPITQLVFRELPQKPIAKDSTWDRRYPGQMSVFKIENIAVFTINDIVIVNSDKAAKITADLSITWEGEKKGEQNGMKYNFNDPIIKGDGNILFNIDEGLLIRGETSTTIEMVVNIEAKDAAQKTVKTIRKDITTNKNIIELL